MSGPSLTKNIPKKSDLHRKLCKMLGSRIQFAQRYQQQQHAEWEKAENTVLAYLPETDLDKQRRKKRDLGTPTYTTIQLPYTYALLMAAHTYLTSVFLGRTPIHQFTGRHGETEDQTQALEALIGYQVSVGQMIGIYYLWLYDALKYGVAIIEEYWEKEFIQYVTIGESPDDQGEMVKMQIRTKMPGYEGNKICNISPYDFLPDPRVPVARFQEGEFCIARKQLSWQTILKRKSLGYYMNVEELSGQSGSPADVGGSVSGSSQLERPTTRDFIADGLDDKDRHPAITIAYECHVSVIPNEWELGKSDYPEKWVFTITGDLATIIGAQPQGAMHGQYPFGVIENEVEAYALYNRGLPSIIDSVQRTVDWLINSHFWNVRAAMNNQFIVDPSKIVARDLQNGEPGFVYRLRPEAYGADIKSFFHQVPVQDVTRNHVADLTTMFGMGERITGINDQILGVLATGGRKTATEVRTSTGFGVNRLKTIAEYMSATGFGNHAQRLVQSSQQFFDASKKLRIVGNLALDAGPKFLEVNPEGIQGFFDFEPVDGTLPVDRLAQANLWKDILSQMRLIPGLLGQYDLAKIFAYVANLAGIRNISQFRIQIGSPEALAQQAEAGNIVPLKPGAAPPKRATGQQSSGVPAGSPLDLNTGAGSV